MTDFVTSAVPPLIPGDSTFSDTAVTGSLSVVGKTYKYDGTNTTNPLDVPVFSVGPDAKIGLFGATPVTKPTAGASATFQGTAGGSTIGTLDTFGGYTIGQVVKALQDVGILG